MRAFHDTRNAGYRTPYGVVAAGEPVELTIDVWDAPDARVQLRTWIDGVGEQLLDLQSVYDDNPADEYRERYRISYIPQAPGVVWYHFVITEAWGNVVRYGAAEGRTGGVGQLLGWEPPSFQLTVLDSAGFTANPNELSVPRALWADAYEKVVHRQLPARLASPGARESMDYPFMEAVVDFLLGNLAATDLAELVETLRENTLPEAFATAFEQLGQHDGGRIFLALAGVSPDEYEAYAVPTAPSDRGEGEPSTSNTLAAALDQGRADRAKGRLWCASLIQHLAPHLPRVYAEAADRYGRIAQLWSSVDPDCEAILCNASDLRGSLPPFEQAPPRFVAANGDLLLLHWEGRDGCGAYLAINASLSAAYELPLPMVGEAASETISGYGQTLLEPAEAYGRLDALPGFTRHPALLQGERYAQVHLNPLGSALLYTHPRERLQLAMEPGVGVLAHITSLPSADKDEGSAADKAWTAAKPAASAATTIASAGTNAIPAVPPRLGTLGSGARDFIEGLAKAGARYWQILPVNPTDDYGSPYAGISAFAGNALLLDGEPEQLLKDVGRFAPQSDYPAFCEHERHWLDPYASFMAIRDKLGHDRPWQEWPKKYRRYSRKLVLGSKELSELFEKHRRLQYLFECQWRELRQYANERGVQIIGDMPIYVCADSADVWADPHLFQLDETGRPQLVAGCPPDGFTPDGQVWGSPVYNWEAVRESGYEWWMRRLERAFHLYDFVRLDHFIGFERYFAIPSGKPARAGAYHPGPGRELFERACRAFGPLPVIAEDLGSITPAVRALCAACGFPGMDIVQFADGNNPLGGYAPRPEKIAYTGTHDNQTLVGYAQERYPGQDASDVAARLLDVVAGCGADVVVFPLQDLALLGSEARMNTPGTAEGNWVWRATRHTLEQAAPTLRHLVGLHGSR